MSQLQDKPNAKDKDATLNVTTFREHFLSKQTDRDQSNQVADTVETDAFLYYSNDEVRLWTISGGILGAAQETTMYEVKRKTRLSFELHPSVFYEKLFSDELSVNEINERISEEVAKNIKEAERFRRLFWSS